MQVLEATKIARKIIRNSISQQHVDIYTNKYKHCRTVKCWITSDDYENEIRGAVARLLPEATVRVLSPISSYYPPSLIIRIPN
jgi:hypothetical protein